MVPMTKTGWTERRALHVWTRSRPGGRPMRCLLALLVVALSASAVSAQPTPEGPPDDDPAAERDAPAPDDPPASDLKEGTENPWAVGVSEANRTKARELYQEGDRLVLEEFLVGDGLRAFQASLARWDHPRTHGRIALILYSLDRWVEAYEHVLQALQYDGRGLGTGLHEQLLKRKAILEKRIGWVVIRTDMPDMEVSVDGKRVPLEDDEVSVVVAPGQHTVVARMPGFLVWTRSVDVTAAERVSVMPQLISVAVATATARRWPNWQPWAITAGGTAAAITGVVLLVRSGQNFTTFDKAIATECPGGCELSESLAQLKSDATWQGRFGVGATILGGLALAGGTALIILNQPRPLHPELMERAAFVPIFGRKAMGVSARWRF